MVTHLNYSVCLLSFYRVSTQATFALLGKILYLELLLIVIDNVVPKVSAILIKARGFLS